MKKNKILFLKGLPGSGKSTFALDLASSNPEEWVRCNKDDIRRMLHSGNWSKKKEEIVEEMQISLAEASLRCGKNVIVDNTHLAPRHEKIWKELAKRNNAEFQIMFFDVSVEDCIKRDLKRQNPVGKDVILKMYYDFLCKKQAELDSSLGYAIICDIDGCLAKVNGRSHYDWDKVGTDLCIEPVRSALELFYNTGIYTIIIVSGRDAACRNQTKRWLKDNNIQYDHLYMRDEGSTEKDSIIKERIYLDHIKGKYNVFAVIDDRPQVVRMWRRHGFFVFNCGDTYEF